MPAIVAGRAPRVPRSSFALLLVLALPGAASAQSSSETVAAEPAPPLPSAAETAAAARDEVVSLPVFEVNASQDRGYVATSTLAGSRLNTSLADTPAAISVFTKEFLDDIGAINVNQALEYSLNGGTDRSDATGNVVTSTEVTVQLRGFVGAIVTRDYFSWSLGFDSYNTERLDFSRGPNSVLYGLGSPAGVLNSTTKRARIGDEINGVRVRVASFDDQRGEVDFGRTLVPGKLAVRVNAVGQNRESYLEYGSEDRRAAAGSIVYRPFRDTTVRLQGEYGTLDGITEQPWPAQERFQRWFAAGRPTVTGLNQNIPGTEAAPSGTAWVFDPESSTGPLRWTGTRASLRGPGSPSLANNTAVITDQSILPRFANIAGEAVTFDVEYSTWSAFVEQRIGKLALEAAYNTQTEDRVTARGMNFNGVALFYDPNVFLPNGQPNPNLNRPYVEGRRTDELRDVTTQEGRLTAGYEWDFADRTNKWIGKLVAAGLVSRREREDNSDGRGEVNLTPVGNQDLTNAANSIIRRTYLDFSGNGRRGAYPSDIPINSNGVTSGLVRINDSSRDDLTRLDTRMIAGQGYFLKDRLVLTGGWRNDKQWTYNSSADLNRNGTTADDRDPVTRLWPQRRRNATGLETQGFTRTFGSVVHVHPRVALTYNNASSFVPQSGENWLGDEIGAREGEGEDFGVRVNFAGGRLNATLSRYEVTDNNRSVSRDANAGNNINAIWRALGQDDRQLIGTRPSTQDVEGEGYEFEVTANITKNWRLSLNAAQAKQVVGATNASDVAYVEANRAEWQANAAVPIGDLSGVTTVGQAITNVDNILAGVQRQIGQTPRSLREYTGNVFTSYSFRDVGPQWLRKFSIGGGANYRGEAVVGYDTTRGNAPVKGGDYILFNAMTAWETKLGTGKSTLRLQLNVDNVFNDDELVVIDADQNQAYRYIYQIPRRWSVTATLRF